MSLSLISFNARGLRDSVKRKALFMFAKKHNSDFCFIQECHSTKDDYKWWKSQWGNDIWSSHATEHSAGVSILRNTFNGDILGSDSDSLGHFQLLVISLNQQTVILGNIYGYNSSLDNKIFFEKLDEKLTKWSNKFPNALFILGGDFNVSINNSLDRYPPKRTACFSPALLGLIDKFELVDIWRKRYPDNIEFTWANKNGSRQSRIDYWLISKCMSKFDLHVGIQCTPLTDHKTIFINTPLMADYAPGHSKASLWKLNSSLLELPDVKDKIKDLISNYWKVALIQDSFCTNWELLKFEIGIYLRRVGADLAKKRRVLEDNLIMKLSQIRNTSCMSLKEKSEIAALQTKLDDLYLKKARGAYIRSRKRWLEEGELNSAYFFKLEKRNFILSTIEQLCIDGKMIKDPKIIANFCSNFYENLYSSKCPEQKTTLFLDSIGCIKTISETDKMCCDDDVTCKEVQSAIKSLKNNKSPGCDGLTAELYKLFANELSPFLTSVIKESINKEALPPTLTQGIITLIPKPKKDLTILDNYRPITLLNNDYKIFAIVFAKRLKECLHSIIDETQSGFMKDRHIMNNIRLVLDLFDYSNLVEHNSFILFLDFYKAFDSVEHHFIFKSLQKFGFGEYFCKAVRTLYYNCNSTIKLKYGTSPRFYLTRGIRQGCPISPYLFLLVSQIFASYISNSSLRGISIANKQILISQLADDTTLFLQDAHQVSLALKNIQQFSKASGLSLNLSKCELMSIKECNLTEICNIKVRDQVSYLGIIITKNELGRCSINFNPLIESTQRKLCAWLQRDLSLKGRILLAKAEGLSRLTYAALSLSVDTAILKKIDTMLLNFVWKNKTHFVRKSVLMNTIDKGGLNFLDFTILNNTFKINWIKNFINKPTSIWNLIPSVIFSKLGGLKFILTCNYSIMKIPIKLSLFHRQILLAWSLIFKHNFTPHSYIIWNNKDLLYKRKSLFFDSWFKNGIIFVSQLFNQNGSICNYSEFLVKHGIPIAPKEFAIVADAVPQGVLMLFKGFSFSSLCHPMDLCETFVGKQCFSLSKTKNNKKIRVLFQEESVSTPYVISYWNGLVSDIPWKKVWTLPHKYLIINKVREIAFKLLHRVYPDKCSLKRLKNDINTLCSFCLKKPETTLHLFWNCSYTMTFWCDLCDYIKCYIYPNFKFSYRNVIFGFHENEKKNDIYFINLLFLLAKYHIHKCKFSKCKPLFLRFKHEMKIYFDTLESSNNLKAMRTIAVFKDLALGLD